MKFLVIIPLATLLVWNAKAQNITREERQREIDRITVEIARLQVGNGNRRVQEELQRAREAMANGNTALADSHLGAARDAARQTDSAQREIDAAAERETNRGELQSRCHDPAQNAQSTCTLGLNQQEMAMMNMAAQQSMQMLGSGGTERSCKAAGTLAKILGAANLAHGAACEAAIISCKNKCKREITNIDNEITAAQAVGQGTARLTREKNLARASKDSCDQLQARVVSALASALQNLASYSQSRQCVAAVSQTPPPGTTPPPMDCTNPMMAASPTCVCPNNPRDPMCSTQNAGLGGGEFASSDGANSAGSIEGGADPEFGDIPLPEDIMAQESRNAGLPSVGGGSGGGGGPTGGGGSAGLPPEDNGGGPGQGPYNTDIMNGLTGGSGGAGSFGSSGSSASSSGEGRSLFGSLAEKFNLKGFLPGKGEFKNRGLAGVAGTGGDGITGPNGPSLFEKVSSRYQKKQSELLP